MIDTDQLATDHSRNLFVILTAILLCGCSWDSESAVGMRSHPVIETNAPPRPSYRISKLRATHLPNPVQVHPQVISGGLPEGDEAFRELQTLGVKTIISVDGMRPDVETAAKYGLKYVHLPHGYDGIPDQRVKELAKAVRDLEGVVYIHCHHGKHRSPAAAATACVSAGLISPTNALTVLELAGTSENYRGLFQSAKEAKPLEQALLDELRVEFREVVDVPPPAEAMVSIEHIHDRLKAAAAAGWRTPPGHPDIEPAHETLLLREHFTELLRFDYVQRQPNEFLDLLRDSERSARELEGALNAWQPATSKPAAPEAFDRLAERITTNCQACHRKFRDIPLGEKSAGK